MDIKPSTLEVTQVYEACGLGEKRHLESGSQQTSGKENWDEKDFLYFHTYWWTMDYPGKCFEWIVNRIVISVTTVSLRCCA